MIFNISSKQIVIGARVSINWAYYNGEGTIVEVLDQAITIKVDNPKACTSGWTGRDIKLQKHEGLYIDLLFTKDDKLELSCSSFSIIKTKDNIKLPATEASISKLEEEFYKEFEESI